MRRGIIGLLLIVFSATAWGQGNWCQGQKSCEKKFQRWANTAIEWKHSSLQEKWQDLDAFVRHWELGQKRQYYSRMQNLVFHGLAKLGFIKTLSPYDLLIRRYSKKHAFDWTLIAAQVYQESRFDPKARSHAGARGLMQLMPRTARELGVKLDLEHPEVSIEAGVRYMAWLKKRFAHLPKKERKWFILGAYNAGIGHVRDAQRLAKRLGLRSNVWFGNVEKAMLLLSKPRYAKNARYGWVRGREPVNYVRAIRKYYRLFSARISA